jgi:hypothetical protein
MLWEAVMKERLARIGVQERLVKQNLINIAIEIPELIYGRARLCQQMTMCGISTPHRFRSCCGDSTLLQARGIGLILKGIFVSRWRWRSLDFECLATILGLPPQLFSWELS